MGTFWAGVHVSKLIARSLISFVLAACSMARLVLDLPGGRSDLVSQGICGSLVPASQGGPMPTGNVATLRWLGTSNYELAYHGKIVIMDTFYERPCTDCIAWIHRWRCQESRRDLGRACARRRDQGNVVSVPMLRPRAPDEPEKLMVRRVSD
jgi:hypothetical protein